MTVLPRVACGVVVAPGPDRSGRRTHLRLIVAIGSLLGAAAVVYGLVVSLWAPVVLGVVLLAVAVYSAVVLRSLRRRS
jgi:uncharacterized membrane-anchored protein